MKKLQIIAVASALSLLALCGAQAETFEGVHSAASVRSRAEVNAEAVSAAAARDQNVGRGSRGAEPFNSSADPDAVYAGAVEQAHAPDQNVGSGSKFNSRIISTMARPPATQAQQSSNTLK